MCIINLVKFEVIKITCSSLDVIEETLSWCVIHEVPILSLRGVPSAPCTPVTEDGDLSTGDVSMTGEVGRLGKSFESFNPSRRYVQTHGTSLWGCTAPGSGHVVNTVTKF